MTGEQQTDPYTILGVERGSSPAEIKNKYRLLVQILHPDRYEAGSPEVREEAERRLKAVNEAYRLLREPEQQQESVRAREAREPEPWRREARERGARVREAREREARAHKARAREARNRRRRYLITAAIGAVGVAVVVSTVLTVMTSEVHQAWSFRSAKPVHSLAVARGVLYAGDGDGNLYALDAKTGAKRWSYRTGGHVKAPPSVGRGMIYIGSGRVHALDAETGAVRWISNTAGVDSSPAFSRGRVYASTTDHHVYGLSAKTGARLWTSEIKSRSKLSKTDTAAVSHGILYVIESGDGIMYALDAKTGDRRWSFRGSHVLSLTLDQGIVYVGDGDGNVYGLDAATGARRWASRTKIGVRASPVVLAGTLLVPGDHAVYALDAKTGASTWTFTTRGELSAIAAGDGVVYAGDEHSVYALNAMTGAQRWASRTGGAVHSLAVQGHTVYIGSGDHKVSALRSPV